MARAQALLPVAVVLVLALVMVGFRATGAAPNLPAMKLKGNPKRGKDVFLNVADCASCHTLRDARAKGSGGPNLDRLKPSFALVVRTVSLGVLLKNGEDAMPSFSSVKGANPDELFPLTNEQIADVARYVSSVAGH